MPSYLFISLMNGAAWGGSEEMWYRLALWMAKNGYNVGAGCYYWDEKNDKLEALRKAGVVIYLLSNKKGLFKKTKLKQSLAAIPFSQYNYTIINQGGWEEVLHAPFKKLYKKLGHYCITNHNYNENAKLPKHKRKLLAEWMANAVMNFGATNKIFEVIEKKFGISISNKQTLINPITFSPGSVCVKYPETDENTTVLFAMLSELDVKRKAQDLLIRTLGSEKWKNRNWRLNLYGKGKDRQMLESLIDEYGLQQKVFLKGYSTNVKETLIECHFLLQCTRIDAMPISVVEAMSVGRPCIVSKVGDMPEWVQHEKNGYVCDTLSIESLDEVFETCWNNRGAWVKLATNAFSTFTAKYKEPYEEKMVELINHTFAAHTG